MAKSPVATNKSARRERSLRSDSLVGSAERAIERTFGLPKGSVRLVKPDRTNARSDKLIGALLKDWGW